MGWQAWQQWQALGFCACLLSAGSAMNHGRSAQQGRLSNQQHSNGINGRIAVHSRTKVAIFAWNQYTNEQQCGGFKNKQYNSCRTAEPNVCMLTLNNPTNTLQSVRSRQNWAWQAGTECPTKAWEPRVGLNVLRRTRTHALKGSCPTPVVCITWVMVNGEPAGHTMPSNLQQTEQGITGTRTSNAKE